MHNFNGLDRDTILFEGVHGLVLPTVNWPEHTAAQEAGRLEHLIEAGDGPALLTHLSGTCTPIPVGCWHQAAESDPDNVDLQVAACFDAAILGHPLPPVASPIATALAALEATDIGSWLRLLDLVTPSRVLRGLLQSLVAARFGRSWLTDVTPRSYTAFGAVRRQPNQPMIDLLLATEPRQPWIEPRPSHREARLWQVPLHQGDEDVITCADYSMTEDCALLVLPDAVLAGHSATVVWEGRQPSDLCVRPMDVTYNANFIALCIENGFYRSHNHIPKKDIDVVILHDIFLTSYFHSMIDWIPRLQAAEVLIRDFGFSIAMPPEGVPMFRRVLVELGFEDVIVDVSAAPTRFRTVAIAATSQMGKYASPASIDWLRRRFRLGSGPPGTRRLLVSRADVPTRRIANEDALLAVLAPLGFERVVPGLMPINAQLQLFASAEVIIAPHGGALTNLIAAAPGTAVIEVLAELGFAAWYSNVSLICGFRHRQVRATIDGVDMVVDPSDVLAALAACGIA